MRCLRILVLLLTSFCCAQAPGDFHPADTNVWGAEYPRVDSTGRVQIRVKGPDATKVRLNFWSGPKVDMEKQPDGFWTVMTPPLVPGLHYYTLIIDGAEVSDTNSRAFFGGGKYASMVEVPEPGSTYYSIQDVPHGQVREVWYNSKVTGTWRHALVYLPPDYQRSPQRRYPVLYLLHGAGGNYTEWTDSFLPEQADRLMVAHEIPPMIVVMPDDGGQTYWANWSEGGPRWADYLTDDIVSTIDQRYRTLANAQSRAIGGLSMGGLGALNLAFGHPDIFGVVGAHSPSVRLEPDPALWFLQGQTFWDNDPVWLAQNRSGLDSLTIWLDAGIADMK